MGSIKRKHEQYMFVSTEIIWLNCYYAIHAFMKNINFKCECIQFVSDYVAEIVSFKLNIPNLPKL